MNRRQFLQRTAIGGMAVSLPATLLGCAGSGTALRPPPPLATPRGGEGGDARVSRVGGVPAGGRGRAATGGPVEAAGETAGETAGGAAGGGASSGSGYFERFGVDCGLLGRVLGRALTRGGDLGEVFLQHRVTHSIGMEDGAINRAYAEVDLGAGVRVLKGDAQGFSFCEDLSERALLAAAATAAAVADGAPSAVARPLVAVTLPRHTTVLVPWEQVGIDAKLPLLARADSRARAADRRIIKVRVGFEDQASHILIADSEGRLCEDQQPMSSLSVRCTAEQAGHTETSGSSRAGRRGLDFFAGALVDELAAEAAAFTVLLFDATPPPAGEYPVVLAPGISGILLHEAIGHGMEADFNRKRISIYSGRIGQRIAPPMVTIVDDATNPGMRGSLNVDDEGAAGERTVLVDGGVLRSYLHDRISASHFGTPRTGSGRRESFRFPPVPRMRNTYLLPGPHNRQAIIASVEKGLYAELFWNGQVQIGAGDFTFYLKHGWLIEGGKLSRRVKDANLIGNGPKVLEQVQMVGDDLAFYSGSGYCGKDGQRVPVGFGLPTIKVGGISVGGRNGD